MLEDSPLLQTAAHSHPASDRCRRVFAVGAASAALLVVVAGVLLVFLYPRTPVVRVDGAGLPPGVNPPVVIVTPPTLFIPLALSCAINNVNFYEAALLDTSSITGYYQSTALQRRVLLGQTVEPGAHFAARAVTQFMLNVELAYEFFASPIVLSEMAADCASLHHVAIALDLDLHIAALFLTNVTLQSSVSVNVSCTSARV